MKYYGIFDQNSNYKLLRYSTAPQEDRVYQEFDFPSKSYYLVSEVCLPDIEYSVNNIGKSYNPSTKQFS